MVSTVGDTLMVDAHVDGRTARRRRNRDAVVDALLELCHAGNLNPSVDQIAEQAGLSGRSLFRYFDDVDDLYRAAIARHHERVDGLFAIAVDADAPTAERIGALVEARLRLFEAIGAVGVLARLRAPFEPIVADELRRARGALRRQVERLFAAELAALGSRSAGVLDAIDALCSFEVYHLLRCTHGRSRARVAAALTDTLRLLLEAR
jgi:AcrR family transcriptional regulator